MCFTPLTGALRPLQFGRGFSVGTLLLLESDAWLSCETDDREADERDEYETLDDGGD